MARPTPSTVKRLFAVSGNQCAFPDCTAPLVVDNIVTAEICHIEAQSAKGPRYNSKQSDEDRHGFDNLILMCGDHHKVIDADEEKYTVKKLIGMKTEHEAKHAGGSEPSDEVARQFLVRVIHEFATPLTSLHQLPPPPGDFTGRENELAQLTAAVEDGGAVIGLFGMDGLGKTVLALKLAQQLTLRYPDAQFYLDLKGTSSQPLTPAEGMSHVIHSYHSTAQLPRSKAELSAVYRSVLYEQRTILVMDNAASRDQIEPLLPPPSCLLLFTSHQHFTLPNLHSLKLKRLPNNDARDLLLKIAPHLQGSSADEIAKLCGYLPLALRLAGSALAGPVDSAFYLEQLRDAQTRLNFVDASLSLNYNLLDTELQRLWCLLSVFPATFDRAAVSSVWEMDDTPIQDALNSLAGCSLVEWNSAISRYRLHDLARLFAGSRLKEDDHTLAHRRHATHYEAVLRAAKELYLQGDESVQRGLALFDLEWPNIQTGQAWAAEHLQEDDAAALLCNHYPDAGIPCLGLRLRSRELVRWLKAAVEAAQRLKDRGGEGAHMGNLGTAYHSLGQVESALRNYEQALAIARDIRDRRSEGVHLGNLGTAYRDRGQMEKAIEHYEQALAIAQEIGDRQMEGAGLGSLGTTYLTRGQVEKAIDHYEQSLAIARDIGDRKGEGVRLENLGSAYLDLGQVKKAIEHYEKSLTIARDIGDRDMEGTVLGNLGRAYCALKQTEKAIGHYEQSLAIAQDIGDRKGEGVRLGSLGSAYHDMGQVERAIAFYEQGLMIAREVGDRRNEGAHLSHLGSAYRDLGQVEKATECYEQALAISREIGNRRSERYRLGNLGDAYRNLEQAEKAIECYEQALVISREIGDRKGIGTHLINLGNAYNDLGQAEKSYELRKNVLLRRGIHYTVKGIRELSIGYIQGWLASLDKQGGAFFRRLFRKPHISRKDEP